MSDPPLYQLRDLARVYTGDGPPRRALDGVTLDIADGEFVALVGPSGSGKTTLLSLLGGLDVAYEGSLKLDGVELGKLSDEARARLRGERIGFVFQAFHLLRHLTVLDNVRLPSLFAVSEGDSQLAAQRALDRVGLGDRAKGSPTELSGGQRQRVAIARALVRNPRVILCDEPTGNLDRATGRDIIGLLAELHRAGATVVVVTHEPSLAEAASRTITLVDGRLAPASPPADSAVSEAS